VTLRCSPNGKARIEREENGLNQAHVIRTCRDREGDGQTISQADPTPLELKGVG